MDNMTGYYRHKADDLSIKANKLKNLLSLMEAPNRRGQSYRMPDGSYVDEFGTPISGSPDGTGIPPTLLADPGQYPQPTPPSTPPNLVSDPNQYPDTTPTTPADPYSIVNPDGSPRQPDRTPPGYSPGTSPGQGFAPTPTGVMPSQPKPAPTPATAPVPAASDPSKEDYTAGRTRYYARKNQQARDEAEERLARISAIDMSKQSASGRAQIAVNKLRAERELKGTKFSDDDINRMVASDTKERFMTPAEKAAREARNKTAVAALSAEAEKRYGPGGGVATIDRRGDNKIQGTNMTFNQFKERYGRDYNALNKDDSNLVRGAASNFAVGRVSQSAQQAAQTADAMNQGYQTQNDDLARRQGELDRRVDSSQRELDRFRNDPQYRDQVRKAEMDKVDVGAVAKETAEDLKQRQLAADQQKVKDYENQLKQNEAKNKNLKADREDYDTYRKMRDSYGAEVAEKMYGEKAKQYSQQWENETLPTAGGSTPTVRQKEAKNYQDVESDPRAAYPELPDPSNGAPRVEAPTPPTITSNDSGLVNRVKSLSGTNDTVQSAGTQTTGMGSRAYSPPPSERNLGGQVTQRASTMNAQPLTGRVSPTAPVAAPRQPLGATITPARPQAAPAVNTSGMNATGSIDDFDNEQQTGGPSERNRALPQPTATPFVQRPLRGRTVTAAARTFNTRGNATRRLA